MACRLDGAKPLSKPMLENCWLGPEEQTSVKFKSELKYFLSRWWTWKYGLRNGVHLSRAQCSVLTDHPDHAEVFYPTDYKSQSTTIHPKGNLWPQLGVAPPLPPPPPPSPPPHPPTPPHPTPPPPSNVDRTTNSLESYIWELFLEALARQLSDPQLSINRVELETWFTSKDTMFPVGPSQMPSPLCLLQA